MFSRSIKLIKSIDIPIDISNGTLIKSMLYEWKHIIKFNSKTKLQYVSDVHVDANKIIPDIKIRQIIRKGCS